jgi:signal transduction histidine kinase
VLVAGLLRERQDDAARLRGRIDELEAARERLAGACAAERRRIERDLHEGAQQRLVALALQVGLARRELGRGAAGAATAAALLDRAGDELRLALDELRDLAREIHPAVLSDRGLEAAVTSLAARLPLPVEVLALPAGRLPATVELTAYAVLAGALADAAGPGGATRAALGVVREGPCVLAEVRHDGAATAAGPLGPLAVLADRVAGLDGRLEVLSPPGGGTLVRAWFPCASS